MKPNHKKYDIIGDIHGHADTLRVLLAKLGYTESNGCYRHDERMAVFVGDFIDRGPKIRETLRIVRDMTDRGHALAVLGNHEWNALRYHTLGPDGKPLRPHTAKNEGQHRATLNQIAEPFPDEWAEWLAWFKTIPLFLDLIGVRVVHASWSSKATAVIGERRFAEDQLLFAASVEGSDEERAVRALLNGPEVLLPPNIEFLDKEGHAHEDIRARWCGPRRGTQITYRDLVFPPSNEPPAIMAPAELLAELNHYDESEPPVIFGHYWMPPAVPVAVAKNAACVDYSVASKTGGLLAAYRWDGEREIKLQNFRWVSSVSQSLVVK